MADLLLLEKAAEHHNQARDEWEEAWEQLFIRRGWDLAQQEARKKLAELGYSPNDDVYLAFVEEV